MNKLETETFETEISDFSNPLPSRYASILLEYVETSVNTLRFATSSSLTEELTETDQVAMSETTRWLATPLTTIPLGLRKSRILGQFMLEAVLVAVAAILVASAVSRPVTNAVGGSMLASAIEAAQPEEQSFSEEELWQAALNGQTLYHYDSGTYAGPDHIDFTFGVTELLILVGMELLIIITAICKGGSFIFTLSPRQIMTTLR